mgnify:CR=1 FL=1
MTRSPRIVRDLTLGALLATLAACGGLGGPFDSNNGLQDGRVGDDPIDDTETVQTAIVGQVETADGVPAFGVTVRAGELEVMTDSTGRFVLEGVPAGRHTLAFSKWGWSKSFRPVTVDEGHPAVVNQVIVRSDADGSFAAGLGANIDVRGAKVDLPAGTYVDANGTAYNGAVQYSATFYDLGKDSPELRAAPGTFEARDGTGADALIESFGMLQVELTTADGTDLELPDGSASRMLMPLQTRGTPLLPAGSMIPAWSFDEIEGIWVQEGAGVVTTLADGRLAWQFDAPHYSTWNVDLPVETRQCVTGKVVDNQGAPIVGAQVEAIGEDYTATTTARTDGEGSFCVDVKRGGTVSLEISFVDGAEVVTHKTEELTVDDVASSCTVADPQCTDLGEIVAIARTCVTGSLVGPDGEPLVGQAIFSPEQGNTVTDESGGFCMQFRAEQEVTFQVVAGLEDDVVWQPIRISPEPANQGCDAGCPNTITFVPYPQTSCVAGKAYQDGAAPGTDGEIAVQVFDAAFPDAPVYNADVAADGTYCAQVPAQTDIDLLIGPADDPCLEQQLSLEPASGTCDTDVQSQSGEGCEPIPMANCGSTQGDDDDSAGDDDDATGDDDDSAYDGDDDDSIGQSGQQ